MLKTKLKHLENPEDITGALEKYKYVMICCGRMGPMCIPVYGIMEKLEPQYQHVQMRDLDYDTPTASYIEKLPECSSFMGLPLTVYFKNGKVVKATSSIQSEKQVKAILDTVFKD